VAVVAADITEHQPTSRAVELNSETVVEFRFGSVATRASHLTEDVIEKET
jgi:hypothetical protein